MRPATLRRLLVFGVCLVGVGCLYLLPSLAGSPSRGGIAPNRQILPTAPPATTAVTAESLGSATTPVSAPALIPALAAATAPSDTVVTSSRSMAGAVVVGPGKDDQPPDAVGRVTLIAEDPDRLTIGWPETDDDRGVLGYRVWLNGFLVLDTQRTRATLSWFNDSDTHVVQVRAFDAAGNMGPSSPILLVTRPTPTTRPTSPAPPPALTESGIGENAS